MKTLTYINESKASACKRIVAFYNVLNTFLNDYNGDNKEELSKTAETLKGELEKLYDFDKNSLKDGVTGTQANKKVNDANFLKQYDSIASSIAKIVSTDKDDKLEDVKKEADKETLKKTSEQVAEIEKITTSYLDKLKEYFKGNNTEINKFYNPIHDIFVDSELADKNADGDESGVDNFEELKKQITDKIEELSTEFEGGVKTDEKIEKEVGDENSEPSEEDKKAAAEEEVNVINNPKTKEEAKITNTNLKDLGTTMVDVIAKLELTEQFSKLNDMQKIGLNFYANTMKLMNDSNKLKLFDSIVKELGIIQ